MMRKILSTVCLLPVLISAAAQRPAATVNGVTLRRSKEPMKLYAITHGRIEEIATAKIDTAGRFGFLFYPATEGYYVIGAGMDQIAAEKFTFYFKPGDQLNVSFGKEGTYELTSKNSKENTAIAEWQRRARSLSYPAFYGARSNETYREFFPRLDSFVKALPAYKVPATGNQLFDASFARMRRLDLLAWAITFMSSPHSEHPGVTDYIPYYRNIRTEDYTQDAFLLMHPLGQRMLTFLPMATGIIAGDTLKGDIETRISKVVNDTLRGEVALQFAQGVKSYLGFLDLQKNYGKYVLTGDQQRRAEELSVKLAQAASKPGQPAVNFTYPDVNGKLVSLTDFKGKVVIVDVWATWCVPCKKEIPALKAMEESYRGKDVVFMSVSVDEAKDEQQWKDYVATEQLKGVQLFASGWSAIAKNYDIRAIPRFMVFDKQGNIVTIDGPRPSGKELQLLLEAELKK